MWGDRVQPPGWPLTWTKPRSRLALLVLLAAHLRVANGQLARDSTELQQLVSSAVQSGGPVSIQLSSGTFALTDTIIISQTAAINITGAGATQTILDCRGLVQAFIISGAATVTLSSLTVQNCVAQGLQGAPGGAGAYIEASTSITVRNCRFIGNVVNATGDGAGGGPLRLVGTAPATRILLDSSTFENNTATRPVDTGGVLVASGFLTVRNCTFMRNSPSALVAANMTGYSVVLTNTGFTTNSGNRSALRITRSSNVTVSVLTCIFAANIGTDMGAALMTDQVSGNITVSSSVFFQNTARFGSAILLSRPSGSIQIINCTVWRNAASLDGAGLRIEGSNQTSSLLISNSVFDSNSGGNTSALQVLDMWGDMFMTKTTFTGNQGDRNAGGVAIIGSNLTRLTVTDSNFTNNRAGNAGGFFLTSLLTTGLFDNCLFSGNNDGALYFKLPSPPFIFTRNNNDSTFFVRTQATSIIFIRNSNFTSNLGSFGGGLYLDQASVVIDNSRFANNSVTNQGGAMYVTRSTATLNNVTIQGNSAQQGGGIFVTDTSSSLTLANCTVADNNATSFCSGLQTGLSAAVIVSNTTWLNNTGQPFASANSCIGNSSALDRTRPPLPPSTDRGTFDPTGPLASPTDTTTFSKNNTGVIVGAVVGGVAGAGLLAGLAAFVVTRKRRAKDAASAGDTKLGAGKDPYSGSAGTTTKGLGASPKTSLAVGGDALAIVSSDGQTAKQANPADTVPTAATTASMTLQPESTVSLEQPTKVSGVQLTGVDSTATLTTSATLTGSLDSYAVYQKELLTRLQVPWASLKLGRVIGKGGFGVVYQGKWQGTDVAIKTFENVSEQSKKDLQREALAMCELRHPYVAQILGLVDDGPHCALVMRYYKGGTVSALIGRMEYMEVPLAYRLKLASQVAAGMLCLHERNIVHGDLKTSNLLIDRDGRMFTCVITDFGLSTVGGEALGSTALTIHISPPEVLRDPRAPRTQAGDVYAFGIVLLEIVSGRPAYVNCSRDIIRRIVLEGKRPPVPAHVPEDISKLIQSCWAEDPSVRPSFGDIVTRLEHEENEAHVAEGQSAYEITATMTMTTIPWPGME